ncbi:MAG: dihydrolipoyl dehydrogenase [Desulfovibrio sp.]|nr:dihydrolipoyl dehydrogenase [Desulfovibrio sp.]
MRLTIIGSGPAGYTAAFEAARRGCAVTLVERDALGGVCLNRGCIPTKTLRASADAVLLAARLAEFGVTGMGTPGVDAAAVRQRKESVVTILRNGLAKSCERLGIHRLHGAARLKDAHAVTVRGAGEETQVEGDAVILAPGSRIRDLPGLQTDHEWICDSNDALELTEIPESCIIVGGGVIGCELAGILSAFGSRVTVVEARERLLPLPSVDADISTLLEREMHKRRIRMLTGRTLTSVRVEEGRVRATAVPWGEAAHGAGEELEAARLFVTVGRAPDTEGLGLGEAGVRVDKNGWIEADGEFRTSVPGICAAGDALGPGRGMLAHVAAMEGLACVETLLGGEGRVDYATVPSAIFTTPEIGCVGLTESQARADVGEVVCATTLVRQLGKAHAMGELPGFFKIVADRRDGRLLGIHMAGAHASDMLGEATLALSLKADLGQMASTIHAHPTLSEGLFETARAALHELERDKA